MKNIKRFKDFFINEAKIDTTDFEHLEFLGGSTGADLYKDSKGNKWVVKRGNSIDQMWNEYTANKVYAKFGIDVPESYIGEIDGEKVFVMEYLEDSIPLGEIDDISDLELDKGFIFDVLTANWDVVGTTYNLDNIRIKDGKAYRVDLGGTLNYRAQGAPKGKLFGEIPTEQKTLRDPNINRQTANIFKNISDDKIRDYIRDAMKSYVVDDVINHRAFLKDIYNVIFDEDNEMSNSDKSNLYRILSKRAVNIYNMFN
jgi:hypothetical protein